MNPDRAMTWRIPSPATASAGGLLFQMVFTLTADLIARFVGATRRREGAYPSNGGIEAEAKGNEKDCRP